jgi:hypothetical protein
VHARSLSRKADDAGASCDRAASRKAFATHYRYLLTVTFLSPQNEAHLVKALEHDIRRAWTDAVAVLDEPIDLLVGARSGVDVDLLIVLDLVTPRAPECAAATA